MTDTTEQTASKAPSHFAYHVREGQDGKGFWTQIGNAWAHADGNGFNLRIDCLPLDGQITLRLPLPKK